MKAYGTENNPIARSNVAYGDDECPKSRVGKVSSKVRKAGRRRLAKLGRKAGKEACASFEEKEA